MELTGAKLGLAVTLIAVSVAAAAAQAPPDAPKAVVAVDATKPPPLEVSAC